MLLAVATDTLKDKDAAVLEAARRLHEEGRPVDFKGIYLEIFDAAGADADLALRTLVANVFIAARPIDLAERLQHLEDALQRRSTWRQAAAAATALKSSRLDAETEAALLEKLVGQRRAYQGYENEVTHGR